MREAEYTPYHVIALCNTQGYMLLLVHVQFKSVSIAMQQELLSLF